LPTLPKKCQLLLATSICVFCEKGESKLYHFSTLHTYTSVKNIARDLQDASFGVHIDS